MTDYGSCIYKNNSSDCDYNSYCLLSDYSHDIWCRKCDDYMLPGYQCNCMGTLITNCSQCSNNRCTKCINGYILENGECQAQIQYCTENQFLCQQNNYCSGTTCNDCFNASKVDKCQCQNNLITGCQQCYFNSCVKCEKTLILVYDICIENPIQHKCIDSNTCVDGMFCDKGQCKSCSLLNYVTGKCNCGGLLISGCNICDIQNKGCYSCLYGYVYSQGSCQAPGTCKSDLDVHCSYMFVCDSNSQGIHSCYSCENMSKLGYSCHCDPARKIYNCKKCEGINCTECIYGFLLKQTSIGWNCQDNFCTDDDIQCLNNYACPKDTQKYTPCEKCKVGQNIPCKCFFEENCSTCDESKGKCGSCLSGFVMHDGNCVPKTNICSSSGSYSCDPSFTCQGEIGDECQPCDQIKEGNQCNCNQTMQSNCKECSQHNCLKCLDGYILINNQCSRNQCGSTLSTQNCQAGFYCPNTATDEHDQCLKCDIQQQECNCGLLKGCQTCGQFQNTCDKCFYGYKKNEQTQQCDLEENICYNQQSSSLCYSDFYCKGNFGDKCESCDTISKDEFCKCGNNFIKNCKKCDGENCKLCIDGFAAKEKECVSNICISGSMTSRCSIDYFCPKGQTGTVNCEPCPSKDNVPCSCGADNCKTCGEESHTCGSCLQGYQLNGAKQCQIKENICDKGKTSSLCYSGYFCKSDFGFDCSSCTLLDKMQYCKCGNNNIQNCTRCDKNQCQLCLAGYLLTSDGKCTENYCDDKLSNQRCAIGYFCNSLKSNDECTSCNISQTKQCNCGSATNCQTCGVLQNTCRTCIRGYYFAPQTQNCLEVTDEQKNICDKDDQSSRCYNNFACLGVFGQQCDVCQKIQAGQSCNCSGNLIKNCQLCQDRICQICLKGFILNKGECVFNQCEKNQDCADNLFCDITTKKCDTCTVSNKVECKCGDAQNCSVCSILPNQCQICLDSFDLINGSCTIKHSCQTEQDCLNNQYCSPHHYCSKCNNFQTQKCNCKQQNCQFCDDTSCKSCIHGYDFDQNEICSIPICESQIPLFNYCHGPNDYSPCPSDTYQVSFMTSPCNCGDSANCGYCDVENSCKICLPGFKLVNSQCYKVTPDFTGVCVQAPNSQFCEDDNSCILPPSCTTCRSVSLGFSCHCGGVEIENCTECVKETCVSCFAGFAPYQNICAETCKSTTECELDQFCNGEICLKCDGLEVCNCGETQNCAICDGGICTICTGNFKLEEGKCDECEDKYEKDGDKCVLTVNDRNLRIATIVFMVIAIISIVGAVIGIIVFYCRKPKKLHYQHRM